MHETHRDTDSNYDAAARNTCGFSITSHNHIETMKYHGKGTRIRIVHRESFEEYIIGVGEGSLLEIEVEGSYLFLKFENHCKDYFNLPFVISYVPLIKNTSLV